MRAESEAWNFYRHRVRVKIEGYRIERLLTKAAAKGIVIRDLKVISDCEVRGWLASSGLKELKKTAGPLYSITVISGRGPEKLLLDILKKPVAIGGALLAAAVVIVQSLFISTVVIDGYKAIPEDALRMCLEQSGISEGVFRPEINWEQARADLQATFPQLTWVQLVYDGRVVYLNVAESSSKILSGQTEEETDIFVPSGRQAAKYSSIVAMRPGYIESVNTLWGVAMAGPGDYVREGDVLISGVVPIEPTTYEEDAPTEYYVRARGQITALVPYRENFNQERYVKSGSDSDEAVVTSLREKSDEQVMAVLNQQIRLWAKENLPESAEIVNKSLNFSYKKNIIEVGVTMEVRQEIGNEKEILVGQ